MEYLNTGSISYTERGAHYRFHKVASQVQAYQLHRELGENIILLAAVKFKDANYSTISNEENTMDEFIKVFSRAIATQHNISEDRVEVYAVKEGCVVVHYQVWRKLFVAFGISVCNSV